MIIKADIARARMHSGSRARASPAEENRTALINPIGVAQLKYLALRIALISIGAICRIHRDDPSRDTDGNTNLEQIESIMRELITRKEERAIRSQARKTHGPTFVGEDML